MTDEPDEFEFLDITEYVDALLNSDDELDLEFDGPRSLHMLARTQTAPGLITDIEGIAHRIVAIRVSLDDDPDGKHETMYLSADHAANLGRDLIKAAEETKEMEAEQDDPVQLAEDRADAEAMRTFQERTEPWAAGGALIREADSSDLPDADDLD